LISKKSNIDVKKYFNSNKKISIIIKDSSIHVSKIKKIVKILHIMYEKYNKNSTLF
jgi:endonuclease III